MLKSNRDAAMAAVARSLVLEGSEGELISAGSGEGGHGYLYSQIAVCSLYSFTNLSLHHGFKNVQELNVRHYLRETLMVVGGCSLFSVGVVWQGFCRF